MYIYICIHIDVYIYIYIYINKHNNNNNVYIYIYIYRYTYPLIVTNNMMGRCTYTVTITRIIHVDLITKYTKYKCGYSNHNKYIYIYICINNNILGYLLVGACAHQRMLGSV